LIVDDHGHETPEYWEKVYGDQPLDWSVDHLLPGVIAGLVPGTALDIGCGEGQNSRFLAEHGWSVLGVDISRTAIARARDRAPAGTRFEVVDARSWKPETPFDLVISTYALPPSGKGRDTALAMAAAAVAPGGTAYVVEFDESTEDLWPAGDLVTVDELIGVFDGFEIKRAEVVTILHQHDEHQQEWPMAVVVAQRSG